MTEEIKLNLDNLTEEEREQLMKLVEKGNTSKPIKSKVWKPVCGETYYVIDANGKIEDFMWNDDSFDKADYEIGNCYRTEEEAEFAVEKRKVEVELQRFAYENNEGGFDILNIYYRKYRIVLGYGDYLAVDYDVNFIVGDVVYFLSEEIAKQAIETVGEDRIKKYIFGVK